MRAAIFNEPRSITAGERRDPVIVEPTDAIVRVVLACVCGSDLWYYRGDSPFEPGPIGHEFIGVIEDVGTEVSNLRRGEFVIAPFAFSDGSCPNCQNGITTACMTGGFYPSNGDGGQGEAVRVPLADSTLVTVPGTGHSDEMLRSLLTLSDVMATGHHAAVCGQVEPGQTVAVVGDGAVGLSAVLAAKRLGADRIVALSRHADRQQLAREFGATDIVAERGQDAIETVKQMTAGVGVDATMECVGTDQSMATAIGIARPLHAVLLLDVADDVAVRRVTGRRFCSWGHPCHVHFNPPTFDGFCDVDGHRLRQRDGDRADAVHRRLGVYHAISGPVVKFYEARGLLRRVDGSGDPAAVWGEIQTTLAPSWVGRPVARRGDLEQPSVAEAARDAGARDLGQR